MDHAWRGRRRAAAKLAAHATPTGVTILPRRIVTAIVVIPLAIVIIAFAVANRQIVTVSFDPFSVTEPAAAITLPLFALIILLLIVGVVIGGVAACCPRERMLTQQWQGEWPGVGVNEMVSSSVKSSSTSSA